MIAQGKPTGSLRVSKTIEGKIRHPWQQVPAELIAHGLQHKNQGSEDFDLRVAFLLFDVGMETLLRTFLLLDRRLSGMKKHPRDRKEIVKSESFYKLVDAVNEDMPSLFSEDDKSSALFFHDLRNRLYHDGNGINVTRNQVSDYADFAVKILTALLGVDLSELLKEPELLRQREIVRQQEETVRQQERDSVVVKKQELDEKVKQIHALVEEIIISIAPKLMYERTWHKFYEEFSKPQPPLPESFFRNAPKESDTSVQLEPEELFDKFLARHIGDEEVRSYFLGLPVDERRRIAPRLVYWIDEELFGEIAPFSLSVELLCWWPEFPYDPASEYESHHLALAAMYPDDMIHRVYDYPGKDIVEVVYPTTDEALSEGNARLESLEAILQDLLDWRTERESRDWELA